MYNNPNLIHGIGNPILVLYNDIGTGGVSPVIDPTLGALKLQLPYSTIENLKFTPKQVQSITAAEGKIKTYRFGYRLSCSFLAGELEKNDFRRFIEIYNRSGDINRSYELRFYAHGYNEAATTAAAREATTPDSIYYRVTFPDDLDFDYVVKFAYKHKVAIGLVGSERLETVPYIWIDSDATEDGSGVLVLDG